MAPFKHGKENIFHIQSALLIALVPIIIWGIYVFGTRALVSLLVSVLVSFLCEVLFLLIRKCIKDFSPLDPLIYGILSGLILPVASPIWVFALSGFIASIIRLITYKNPEKGMVINPISACGIFLFGFLSQFSNRFTAPFEKFSPFQSIPDDMIVTTILKSIKNGTDSITNSTLINTFLGRDSGAIGEISTLLILIGGIYLIRKKFISFEIPVSILSTVFLISFFFPTGNCEAIYCASIETLSGGLFLWAFFIAPLPSSSPLTKSGKIIFGISIGIIVMALRRFTSAADGAAFAVGIVSIFTRTIDLFTGNKYFSYLLDEKKTAEPKKTDLESLLKDE